jgi:putative glutamine amidotransferase
MSMHPPVVGIVADFRLLEPHMFHCVGHKYVSAVAQGSEVLPILLPALAAKSDFDAVLELVDGLMFTGSPSNVAPHHFNEDVPSEQLAALLDEKRDGTTLPLIRLAIERAIPVLGLCRGFQEINVALGGSLYQEVHKVPGLSDHRENEDDELDLQYAPSHPVFFTPGGKLARMTGVTESVVNSLHGQGVNRLADGLVVEARAPDGLVEAFSVANAPALAVAVQWHPEWRFDVNPVSQAIFRSFGAACRERRERRSNAVAETTPISQRSGASSAPQHS